MRIPMDATAVMESPCSTIKMGNYIVYKHTSPSDKVYIGITGRTVKERWGRNGTGYRECPYFWRAIQKYGWDNIKHEILYEGLTQEEACEMEIKLIAEYDATNPEKGYNDLLGGTTGKHSRPYTDERLRQMSETQKRLWEDPEYRKRLSDAHKGKVIPLEQRKKMSEAHKGKPSANKGKPLSEETKAKLSKIMKEIGNKPPSSKGRKQTEEAKRKIGEAHKGFNPFSVTPLSEAGRERIREKNRRVFSKPVLQYTKDGEFVAEYPSATEAANHLGKNKGQANISTCIAGRISSAYGYVWKLKEITNG